MVASSPRTQEAHQEQEALEVPPSSLFPKRDMTIRHRNKTGIFCLICFVSVRSFSPQFLRHQNNFQRVGRSIVEGEQGNGESLDKNAIDALWGMTPKALLSIGGKGVQDSHVRSLNTLLRQHDVVKVKLSDHRTEPADCVAAFASGLGSSGSLVSIHGSGRYLLYEGFSCGENPISFSTFVADRAAKEAARQERRDEYEATKERKRDNS